MKNVIKRLCFIVMTTALIATMMTPCANSADATTLFKQKKITISKSSRQVVDTLSGVKAYYRKGGNDGSNKFYSCAAFVKRYYNKIYDTNENNLLYNRTPHAEDNTFVQVEEPQVGDIVAMNTNHGTTHWAIVKNVNDNDTITLIEQNWKWLQSSSTKSVVNRKVKTSNVRLYRLKTENKVTVTLVAD